MNITTQNVQEIIDKVDTLKIKPNLKLEVLDVIMEVLETYAPANHTCDCKKSKSKEV